ncbi:MAG: hypothetical protein IPN97_07870 [Saprospiraceae bacterium]|nr:hypothetical protein [Saprospiraceae bacterium]
MESFAFPIPVTLFLFTLVTTGVAGFGALAYLTRPHFLTNKSYDYLYAFLEKFPGSNKLTYTLVYLETALFSKTWNKLNRIYIDKITTILA